MVEALRRTDLFRVVDEATLERVAADTVVRDHRRGDAVWTRGESSDWVVIPLSGRIKCWIEREKQRAWVRRVVRPGHCCGLVPAVDGSPHPCSAEAVRRSRVAYVPTELVRDLLGSNAPFAAQVSLLLATCFRETIRSCEQVTLHTPLERLARYVRNVVNDRGVGEFDATQSEIAAELGTVREVIGRGLRRLETDGIVTRTGRKVRVLRPDALERIVAG